jgi:hypothetical protein
MIHARESNVFVVKLRNLTGSLGNVELIEPEALENFF